MHIGPGNSGPERVSNKYFNLIEHVQRDRYL